MISESYAERILKYIQEAEKNPDILKTQKLLPADYRSMGTAAQLFTKSMLIGLDSSLQKKQFDDEDLISDIENLPYEEAVEYLSKRSILKKDDYYKLSDKLKFRAFTVGRINDGRLLEKLNAEMIKNVNDGKGLKDFLALTKTDILNKIGMGPNQGWYWETVYRTNVQTAYNVGRAMGFEEDPPIALEFVGVDDARQTDTCSSLSGVIRPYDDPFWEGHTPPLHFKCRSTLRGIYDESELPKKWSDIGNVENAAKGFGSWPTENDSWWEELASQTRAAKYYGVQQEIARAEKMFSLGRIKGKGFSRSNIKQEKETIKIKIKKVNNKINRVKKGKPMTFDEADNGRPNPNYKSGTATAQSCQSCVPVFKARLDGFNIQTKPFDLNNKVMNVLSLPGNTKLAYIDKKTGSFPDYIIPPDRKVPEIYKWLNNQIDKKSYYSFEFYKKGGGDGHVMCICWNDDDLLLYDPQTNEKIVGDKILPELWTIRTKTIKLINISNCKLNKYVLDYISEASK